MHIDSIRVVLKSASPDTETGAIYERHLAFSRETRRWVAHTVRPDGVLDEFGLRPSEIKLAAAMEGLRVLGFDK